MHEVLRYQGLRTQATGILTLNYQCTRPWATSTLKKIEKPHAKLHWKHHHAWLHVCELYSSRRRYLANIFVRIKMSPHTHTSTKHIPAPPLAFSGPLIGPPASSRQHYSPVVPIIQEGSNPENNPSLRETNALNISKLVDHLNGTVHFFSTL